MSGESMHAAASKLVDLLAHIPDQWNDVEVTARGLADELRVKDGQNHVLAYYRDAHLIFMLPFS